MTDNVITPGLGEDGVGTDRLVAGAAIILIIAAVRGLGSVVRRYYLSMAESRTKGSWRSAVYRQYLLQPLSYLRSTPTGDLIAHADNDMVVAGIVLRPLAFAVATVVLAILAVISLALVHWAFGIVALVVLPVLFVLNNAYSKRVAVPAARVQQGVADVTGVAHESFDGIMIIKSLGRTDDEIERMRVSSAELRERRLVVGRLRAVFEPLLEILPNLGIVVLLLIGGSLVANESVTVGELIGAMSLFNVLGLPIRIVGFFLQSMPASVVALERIDGVLDLPEPEVRGGDTAELLSGPLPSGPLPLSIDDLSFAHGDHQVLDGLSLDIAAGETVALVGATGSGKTTILELIAGLTTPDGGDMSIGGVSYENIAPRKISERVGLVFQETFLFAQSIRENITMRDRAGHDGTTLGDEDRAALVAAATASRAHGFIQQTPEGYETVVGERGVTLSGGQRQRVALARAIYRRPSLLLLDDATSAVDPTIEAEILRGIDAESMTVLIVAHRLSTILLADRVVFLEDGKIAASGTHEDLLAEESNEGYRTLVQAYEQDSSQGVLSAAADLDRKSRDGDSGVLSAAADLDRKSREKQ